MRLANAAFGRRLAAIRRDHGLVQAELAAAIGKSRQAINHWEAGMRFDVRTSDACHV
jgi:transcriptional regulator with XRE-family HTH domain